MAFHVHYHPANYYAMGLLQFHAISTMFFKTVTHLSTPVTVFCSPFFYHTFPTVIVQEL